MEQMFCLTAIYSKYTC